MKHSLNQKEFSLASAEFIEKQAIIASNAKLVILSFETLDRTF